PFRPIAPHVTGIRAAPSRHLRYPRSKPEDVRRVNTGGSKARDDVAERGSGPIFVRLGSPSDVDQSREFLLWLQTQSVKNVTIERKPAGQPACAISECCRGRND